MLSCPFMWWLPPISAALQRYEFHFFMESTAILLDFSFVAYLWPQLSESLEHDFYRISDLLLLLEQELCSPLGFYTQKEDIFNIRRIIWFFAQSLQLFLNLFPIHIWRLFFYSLNITDIAILYFVPSNTITWDLCRSDSAVYCF